MKRVVIFVPHQDDETNLVGNILADLVRKYNTYIVYSSLEIDADKAYIRKKEAMNACAVYGIDEKNIIFLGYPDTPNRCGYHYFTNGDKSIIDKIEKILFRLKPEIIIGTDFDFHSDHRMLSLALDEAVANILRADHRYNPMYLKGFCYETAYYGVDDYSASDLKGTNIKSDYLGNVSYKWEDRISIKSSEGNGYIFQKIPYKALKCHKSQYAVLHARSVINADNVFWEKRTDNILLHGSKITASSGDVEKLIDLKIIDTSDITTYDPLNIDYSKGLWIPDTSDEDPHVSIDFLESKIVHEIIFHGDPAMHSVYECDIEIVIGNSKYFINHMMPFGQSTTIILPNVTCNHIDIFIHTKNSLSELEIFEKDTKKSEDILSTTERKKKCHYIDFWDKLFFKVNVVLIKTNRKLKLWKGINK